MWLEFVVGSYLGVRFSKVSAVTFRAINQKFKSKSSLIIVSAKLLKRRLNVNNNSFLGPFITGKLT